MTYDTTLAEFPKNVELLRLLIGDTNITTPAFKDSELATFLSYAMNDPLKAAGLAARALAASLPRLKTILGNTFPDSTASTAGDIDLTKAADWATLYTQVDTISGRMTMDNLANAYRAVAQIRISADQSAKALNQQAQPTIVSLAELYRQLANAWLGTA